MVFFRKPGLYRKLSKNTICNTNTAILKVNVTNSDLETEALWPLVL